MLEQKSNSIEERVGTYLRRVYGLVVKGSSLEPEGPGLIPETTNFLTNSSGHGQATYACVSLFTKQYKIDTSYLYIWLAGVKTFIDAMQCHSEDHPNSSHVHRGYVES